MGTQFFVPKFTLYYFFNILSNEWLKDGVENNPINHNNTILDRIRCEMSIIELTNKNLLDIEKNIDSCIATRNERMMEIPGIGSVLCATILAKIGDITKMMLHTTIRPTQSWWRKIISQTPFSLKKILY